MLYICVDIFDFIWEEPIIPLEFSEEEVGKCKALAYKITIQQWPELEFENYRLNLDMMDKAAVVNMLSSYFNRIVKELQKQKNDTK